MARAPGGGDMRLLFRKLREPRIWRRLWYERLTEPLVLNLASVWVALFGSFRQKVAYDLVLKQPYAFGLLAAADRAKHLGFEAITAIEFGVAQGEGLLNLQLLGEAVHRATGVRVECVGFDTGTGMPAPTDWRDHPNVYLEHDFPMDADRLRSHLTDATRLVLGDVAQTVPAFLEQFDPAAPVGFVSIDLDTYHSTLDALTLFEGRSEAFLPLAYIYLDDIIYDFQNSWCGELGAVAEFNRRHERRKIERSRFFEHGRLFRRAPWVRQVYLFYDFESEWWNTHRGHGRKLDNAYLEER